MRPRSAPQAGVGLVYTRGPEEHLMTVSVQTAVRGGFEFDWRRYLPAIAMFAGLAWLCFGLESIVRPHEENYRNALFYVPWLPSIAVVYGLHDLHRGFASQFERWSARLLLGSMALVVVAQPAFIFDVEPLLPLAIAGFVGFVAGTVSFGAALYRLGLVSRPLAAGLAFTQLGTMAMGLALSPWVPLADDGSYSGAVFHGVVFSAAALWLMKGEREKAKKKSDRPWAGGPA